MRIISKYKDYYDGLRAYDCDPEPVYVRKTEYRYRDESPELWRGAWCAISPPYFPRVINPFLFFCGRQYIIFNIGGKSCLTFEQILEATQWLAAKDRYYKPALDLLITPRRSRGKYHLGENMNEESFALWMEACNENGARHSLHIAAKR